MSTLVLLAALFAPLAFLDKEPSLDPTGEGFATFVCGIPFLWFLSLLVSVPVLFVLTEPDAAQLERTPSMYAWLLLALLGAWLITRIFSTFRERRWRVALRAAIVIGTTWAGQAVALDQGVTMRGAPVHGMVIGFVAASACVGCWKMIERAHYPLRLVALSLLFGLLPFLAGGDRGILVDGRTFPDPATAPTGDLFFALLQCAVLIMAGVALAFGIERTIDWVLHGPKPPRKALQSWPPAMGQIWWAKVDRDDTQGSKVRPVLVWDDPADGDRRVQVLQLTSQDKAGDQRYLALDPEEWSGVLKKVGYLNLGVTHVPKENFRQYVDGCPDGTWEQALDLWRKDKVRPDSRNYDKGAASTFLRTLGTLWGDETTTQRPRVRRAPSR